MELRLRGRTWTTGERIGSGGFGQVYVATSADGDTAVAKLVPKDVGADRELLFVDLKGVRNVVPIIDSGETETHWVLVMPRADGSLRDHLQATGGPLETTAAVLILQDIATALSDLDGKVVHRDLKPENVLLLDSTWCLADFGISRYAEATTSPDTQKFAWSPPYAAPERWLHERATSATDIYSFGIIAFELLSGSTPFRGPTTEDYREQHLAAEPPPLPEAPSTLQNLILQCLNKAAGGRPSPSRIVGRLSGALRAVPAGLEKLRQADLAEVARRDQSDRLHSKSRLEQGRRAALLRAAAVAFKPIADELSHVILETAPSAYRQSSGDGWLITLGPAQLGLAPPAETPEDPWGEFDPPAFDVVAHTLLNLVIPADRHGYEGRSHSIWYCDAQEGGRYQWFETSFMFSPMIGKQGRQDPFALFPGDAAARALWTGMAEYQLAWPFEPLSDGDLDEFIERWAAWFAEAALGQLHHPSRMPERRREGSFRRK